MALRAVKELKGFEMGFEEGRSLANAEEASSPRDSLSKLSSPLGSSLFNLITYRK